MKVHNVSYTDIEKILGREIYLNRYENEGAVWRANEHREVWYAMARDLIERLAAANLEILEKT